ncbi:hypothetical protein DVH05_007616 [Phytophthora capsici]|nr:hypothetical protein DVH05_007616 [Phytophthora capsici]
MEAEKEIAQFGQGDLVISRGDFIHGGGDYKAMNIRVHFFLDPQAGTARKVRNNNSIDLIRVIPKRNAISENAESKQFTTAPKLRKHIREDHGIYFNRHATDPAQRGKKKLKMSED